MLNVLPHLAEKPAGARLDHPRYLLREDGHFVAWTAQLAKKAELRPFDELPEWHLRKLEEAALRDARVRQAQLERKQGVVAAQAGQTTPAQQAAKAQCESEMEMIGKASSKRALRPFFAARKFKADYGKPLAELQSIAFRLALDGVAGFPPSRE